MSEPVHAVLFDFSGTLMRAESAERWVAAVLTEAGVGLSEEEIRSWALRLEGAGVCPVGTLPGTSRIGFVPSGTDEIWTPRPTGRPTPD
ncbi:hypothetical protein ACFQX6_25575 [Streptosporangium lutulentum]